MKNAYTYTTAATRLVKKSMKTDLHIIPAADGTVYVTDGRYMIQLTAADYAALIQPATLEAAAPMVIRSGEKSGAEPMSEKAVNDLFAAGKGEELQLTPFSFMTANGVTARIFYSGRLDKLAAVNADYLAMFPDLSRCSFSGKGVYAPVIIQNGDLHAAIMPLRFDGEKYDSMLAACRTLYGVPAAAKKSTADDDRYQRLYAASCENIDRLEKELKTLQAELDAVKAENAALKAAADEKPAAAPTDAEIMQGVADQIKDLTGIRLEVKGGCYLWIYGESRPHKDALQAAGCRWSAKRSAWYWSPSCKKATA